LVEIVKKGGNATGGFGVARLFFEKELISVVDDCWDNVQVGIAGNLSRLVLTP